jgi:DNA-binding GntR family transcriptional regulator
MSPPRKSRTQASDSDATATDRVYEAIYLAVVEHRLAPGEWLREEEMATEFGISRTVVRQALQRLAQDQVIELRHNRGARVPLPSMEDAVNVFEARRIVECEVARRLGGRLTEEQLTELREIAQAESDAEQRGDRSTNIRLSGEFHHALARMHGNPVFVRLLNGLLPTTSLLMARFKVDGRPVCVAHRHAEVIAALERGGAPAAAEMRRHMVELERSLVDTPVRGRRLRDAFAAYRESPDSDPSNP